MELGSTMDGEQSDRSMEDLSDGSMSGRSSPLSLSCSFSSFEHEESGRSSYTSASSSSEDETGTVEPYMYEPEESHHEGLTSNSSSEGDDSDDEGRIGNTEW